VANTTWNPSDKSANITLSGTNNLTATTSSGIAATVRAIDKQITGKFYWEIAATTVVTTAVFGGFSSSASLSLGFTGAGSIGTCGVANSGYVFVDSVNTLINIGSFTSGALICIAFDVGARLAWFRLGAAGNWNGSASANPATGSGGIANTLGDGIPLYPAANFGGTGNVATANFGDSAFTGTVPSGFTAGFTANPVPTGGFAGLLSGITSGNAGANSIFLTQVVAQKNGTAKAVLIDTANATTGINFKVLVYDASHNTLLATGSTVTSVAAGYNRFPLTANLSLTAGTTYYVGYVCDSTCFVSTGTVSGAASWFVSGGQSVTTPANPLVGGASNSTCLMVGLELDGTGTQGYGYSVDQSSGVTLSASNTVATFASTSQQGARSLVTHATGGAGNFYAEIAVSGTTVQTDDAIGIAAVAWNPNQATPTSSYLFALQASGFVIGSGNPNIALTWAAGDVIGIALNCSNRYLWWNKNNGPWYGSGSTAGNPITGLNPLALSSSMSWPMAISVLSQTAGTSAAFTLHDTAASLQYAPPSGYSAWAPPPLAAIATNALVTQIAVEHWLAASTPAQVTQVALEHWASVAAAVPSTGSPIGVVIMA
jgi:hypothetical protein